MKQIVEIQLQSLKLRLAEKRVELKFTDYALEQLGIIGYDPSFGARPVKRVIQKRIENELANLILAGKLPNNSTVAVDFVGDEFQFKVKPTSTLKSSLVL
jgi:ATP-dependent Clp protease ATP-binding subunit ClpA